LMIQKFIQKQNLYLIPEIGVDQSIGVAIFKVL